MFAAVCTALRFRSRVARGGVTRERYALRNLRTYNAKTKRLDSFRDDIIDTAYGGVGVSAFKNRQASSVESTVERLERERERMEQIKRECQENIRRTQEILAQLGQYAV